MGACCSPSVDDAENSTTFTARRPVPKADELIAQFMNAGQGRIFDAWDNLGTLERENLLNECSQFDVDLINDLYSNLVANPQPHEEQEGEGETVFDTVEPERIVDASNLSSYKKSIYQTEGNELIRSAKVGVVILAGG